MKNQYQLLLLAVLAALAMATPTCSGLDNGTVSKEAQRFGLDNGTVG